jgi:hypothetical protein
LRPEQPEEALGAQVFENCECVVGWFTSWRQDVLVELAQRQVERQVELSPSLSGGTVRIVSGQLAA